MKTGSMTDLVMHIYREYIHLSINYARITTKPFAKQYKIYSFPGIYRNLFKDFNVGKMEEKVFMASEWRMFQVPIFFFFLQKGKY